MAMAHGGHAQLAIPWHNDLVALAPVLLQNAVLAAAQRLAAVHCPRQQAMPLDEHICAPSKRCESSPATCCATGYTCTCTARSGQAMCSRVSSSVWQVSQILSQTAAAETLPALLTNEHACLVASACAVRAALTYCADAPCWHATDLEQSTCWCMQHTGVYVLQAQLGRFAVIDSARRVRCAVHECVEHDAGNHSVRSVI
jgi:hypothetical protein